MKLFKMLVLTDHSTHSGENSIYALLRELSKNPRCKSLAVASRGIEQNRSFFYDLSDTKLFASPVGEDFVYRPDGYFFEQGLRTVSLKDFDVIFLRLPHPVGHEFWTFLKDNFSEDHIINQPSGIEHTGSKKYLLNFPDICPNMKLCTSVEDVVSFKEKHPIVLKPLHNYGGKGVIRVENERVWEGNEEKPLEEFLEELKDKPFEYLGMEFMKNVHKGDKRVVVVNGKVLGASLRMPPEGSWICNAAQGGTVVPTEPNEEEIKIAKRIYPHLREHGIIMFGFDTLVNNDGKRILSEINTMSIGGIPQIEQQSGRPVVKQAADLIWDYVKNDVYGESIAA